MSIFVTSSAWKGSHAEGTALLVLLAIADFADDKGRAFPSVKTLAIKSRASERTVQYALRDLIKKGELTIDRNAGPHGCNVYRVQLQAMTWEPEESDGGANSAGVQHGSFGGATRCTQTTIEPSKKKESAGAKRIPEPTFDPLTGKFDGIRPETIAQWSDANPAVDVPLEISRAGCWLIANPERNKTRYLRFLAGWMSRASDRREGGATAIVASQRPMSEKERHREEWAKATRESYARIRAIDAAAEQHRQRANDDDNTFDA